MRSTYRKIALAIGLATILFLLYQNSDLGQEREKHVLFPEPIGYVNDFEDILSEDEEAILSKIIEDHEARTTKEIAIVTIRSIAPYDSLHPYSLDLANYWGVGKEKSNNGVLIAVSKTLRSIRIQNGLGIEEILSDEQTKLIIDEQIIPAFKEGNYFLGLKQGLEELIKELD